MINTILYSLLFLIFLVIWQYMRSTAQNNRSWKTLLAEYSTMETSKTLSGRYLNIITCYFDERYLKRIYKFYDTPKGLLISPSPQFFIKQSVLIPWQAIETGELHNRGYATMQRLKFEKAEAAKIDITRADFIQYIQPNIK